MAGPVVRGGAVALVVLGTGSQTPTRHRNHNGCAGRAERAALLRNARLPGRLQALEDVSPVTGTTCRMGDMQSGSPPSSEAPVLHGAGHRGTRPRYGRWIAVALSPFVALALLIAMPMWKNDRKLDEWMRQAVEYPLPPDTSSDVYGAQGSVGLLRGNSNHCDFLVRISLLTSLPEEQIIAYYAESGDRGGPGLGQVYTRWEAGPGPRTPGPRTVIVEFFGMYDPGWDPRCH
jgi:hypothetical protein